jgi:hypothetical protein
MALEGNLKDFGITDILQLIGMQKKTGVLTLASEEDTVTVTIEEGMVVAADSYLKNRSDLLGESLVAAELLKPEQLEKVLTLQKERGQKLGHLLIREKMLKQEDLAAMVQLQVHETIYRIFDWREGTYRFEQAPVTYDKANMIPLSCETILMEAMRMVDEWPMIRKAIPDLSLVFAKTDEKRAVTAAEEDLYGAIDRMFDANEGGSTDEALQKELPLSPAEEKIYRLVDGRKDVEKLVALGRMGTFETCKALFSLVSSGLIGKGAAEGKILEAKGKEPDKFFGKKLLRNLSAYAIMLLFLALLVLSSRRPVGGVLFSLMGGMAEHLEPLRTVYAVQEMSRVLSACDIYYLEEQVLPPDLETLVQKRILQRRDLLDPWGRTYHYRVEGKRVVLSSAGTDGVDTTTDDLVEERTL